MPAVNTPKYLLYLSVLLLASCQGSKNELTILPKPVFEESDSQVNPLGNTLISKYGYYLVRGESHDKQYIKKVLDSFVNKNRFIDGTNYANYLLFFYKESEALNEEIVQSEEEKYRYKLFVHREGMIASYYIRDSAVFDITWGDEYK